MVFFFFAYLCLPFKNKHILSRREIKKYQHYEKFSRNEHLHVFQDDFCQQVFEVLVEIFRKECQNCLGRGEVAEHSQSGEAVQGLEQLRGRRGAWAVRGTGTGGRAPSAAGKRACHPPPSLKMGLRSPEAPGAGLLMPTCLGPPPSSPAA